MSQLIVVAKVVAKKESVENVKRELLKLVAPTRKEAGCITYKLHQDNDEPAVFIFYEIWEDASSLGSHMQTEHFRNYVKAVDGLIEEKIVHKMAGIE